MTDSISDMLTVQKPAGIPWRLKTAELMPDAQWRTLMALMDTIVPSIQKESTAPKRKSRSIAYISDSRYQDAVSHLKSNTIVLDNASERELDQYLSDRPTDDLMFQQVLKGMLHHVPPELQTLLSRVLYLLTTQAGSLILTGYATPITKLPLEDRTKILHKWANSSLYKIRGLYRQVTTLAKVVFSATNPAFIKLSGFPTTPEGWKPPTGYPYDFIQFPPAPAPAPGAKTSSRPPPVEIGTDVVIVGSGCGAGVCAKNLAEAGHRVLVVDKSYYFDASSFPMVAGEGFFHLFEGACTTGSDDNSISVVAGSCFGGGGTINWSASLHPQGFVRDEWVRERGLTFFGTQEFQNCLDRVCGQMGVHEDFEPNHGNAILLDGARKLGWSAKKVPQNTDSCAHDDGHCAMGCSTGEKKGPVNGWFPDAARHGAKFAEGFKVKKVLFDESGKKKAVGVVGTWTSRGKDGRTDGPDEDKIVREVVVKAKKVIISSGTLCSPVILKNSGLKNSQIGRNLYLHPVNVMHGFFKEDVRPWEGGILTTVVNTFENSDGKGHGPKLEALSMMPCFSMQFLNWTNGVDFKLLALKYRHLNSYISIVRDRDTGSVYPDPVTGQPRVIYTTSAFDRAHAMIGLVALAKILYLQGALEIHAGLPGMRPFIREDASAAPSTSTKSTDDLVSTVSDAGIADPRFQAWLAELEKHGNRPPTAVFCSAHQMGTNRMSTSDKTGVVDPRGRVWGTEGLYVSDASVFPSASGVNPMVTNMAISDWISRNIAGDLAKDGERSRL